jgi:hypothetical protein
MHNDQNANNGAQPMIDPETAEGIADTILDELAPLSRLERKSE